MQIQKITLALCNITIIVYHNVDIINNMKIRTHKRQIIKIKKTAKNIKI